MYTAGAVVVGPGAVFGTICPSTKAKLRSWTGAGTEAMKIIAVTNIKGGVGKTTAAVNLAYLCAAGQPTLLWDLDPQGAATYLLRGTPHEHASAKKLVAGKRQLPELILSTGYARFDLLPADFSYRNFDVHLSARKRPTAVVGAHVGAIAGLYCGGRLGGSGAVAVLLDGR